MESWLFFCLSNGDCREVHRFIINDRYHYDTNDKNNDPFEGNDCKSLGTQMDINPLIKHYIYHARDQKLIFYDINIASNKRTQNERGISLGTVRSDLQMRRIILH
jgi:hypothetical protein